MNWHNDIYDTFLSEKVRTVAYLPDAGHAALIDKCLQDDNIHAVPLATEMEGIGIACGSWLGGDRAAVLMQSSGVGNCVNALALPAVCRFPLLMLVTMRGEYGEGQPWQMPMGQAVRPVLEAMGVLCFDVTRPEEVQPAIENALTLAYRTNSRAAVLLTQKLIGAKKFTA